MLKVGRNILTHSKIWRKAEMTRNHRLLQAKTRWCSLCFYRNSEEARDSRFRMMDMLRGLFHSVDEDENKHHEQLLEEVDFTGIVKYIQSNKCKNIVVMVGAGISTSAGIPDFRSPKSGLYANLQKYDLPSPEAIFDIGFFRQNPRPFFQLAKELYPGKFKPTPSHYFLKLLHDKGLLLRLYTQNIDTLERVAGIPGDKLIEAHGTFFTSHCIGRSCHEEYTLEWMREKIFADVIPTCIECGNTVKPDIVFFGEQLPDRFFECAEQDFSICDLLIIIGTSLSVQPFASLVDNVSPITPRLLINKEKCGQTSYFAQMIGIGSGLDFDSEKNYRDVAWIGNCDDGCQELAEALGWGEELKQIVQKEHTRIDAEYEDSIKKK